jgi:hypothetical protein
MAFFSQIINLVIFTMLNNFENSHADKDMVIDDLTKHVRSNTRSEFCNSTKEELLKGDVLKVWEDCPLCAQAGVLCYIGFHPGKSSPNIIILSSSL